MTCTNFRKYRHKGKDFYHKEGANVQTYHYYEKPKYLNKNGWKGIKEEKENNNKNGDNKNKCNNWKMNNYEINDCYNKKKSEKEYANNITGDVV